MTCHAAGSGCPAIHALARNVVGETPCACNRRFSFCPGTYVVPVNVADANVVSTPATLRCSCNETAPVTAYRTFR